MTWHVREQAQAEMTRAGFSEDQRRVFTAILDLFFGTFDTSRSVRAGLWVLNRLIAGKPLTPLTGEADEWLDVGEGRWQNLRCSMVFRDADGRAYDLDAPGRPTITFPYTPEADRVRMPVYEMGM